MCTPGQIHDKRHLQEWLRAEEWQTHSRRSLWAQGDGMFSTSACVHIQGMNLLSFGAVCAPEYTSMFTGLQWLASYEYRDCDTSR